MACRIIRAARRSWTSFGWRRAKWSNIGTLSSQFLKLPQTRIPCSDRAEPPKTRVKVADHEQSTRDVYQVARRAAHDRARRRAVALHARWPQDSRRRGRSGGRQCWPGTGGNRADRRRRSRAPELYNPGMVIARPRALDGTPRPLDAARRQPLLLY